MSSTTNRKIVFRSARPAGEDLVDWKYKAVKLDGNNDVIKVTANTDALYGFLMNNKINITQATEVTSIDGGQLALCDDALTAGDYLVLSDSNIGQVKKLPVAAGTYTVIGKAIKTTTTTTIPIEFERIEFIIVIA